MSEWRIVRDQPRLIRMKSDAPYRGAGWFALGAVLTVLFLLVLLGWFGVLAIARDVGGAFATLVLLGFGAIAFYAGARSRWAWCELEIADVAITVVDGFGWRIKRTARIERPVPGLPLTVVIESDDNGDGIPLYWLRVYDGEPRGPIVVGRGLNLSRKTFEEIAEQLERWAARAG